MTDNLAALGASLDTVESIAVSHLHVEHVGWLDQTSAPCLISAREWAGRGTSPGVTQQTLDAIAPRVRTVADGDEVCLTVAVHRRVVAGGSMTADSSAQPCARLVARSFAGAGRSTAQGGGDGAGGGGDDGCGGEGDARVGGIDEHADEGGADGLTDGEPDEQGGGGRRGSGGPERGCPGDEYSGERDVGGAEYGRGEEGDRSGTGIQRDRDGAGTEQQHNSIQMRVMSQRCTASPTSAPASPAAPSRVQKTLELVVFRYPLFKMSSPPNVQIGELPTPRSTAAVSAAPRRRSAGAVWGVVVAGWWRDVAIHTPVVARVVTPAKQSQARRH